MAATKKYRSRARIPLLITAKYRLCADSVLSQRSFCASGDGLLENPFSRDDGVAPPLANIAGDRIVEGGHQQRPLGRKHAVARAWSRPELSARDAAKKRRVEASARCDFPDHVGI